MTIRDRLSMAFMKRLIGTPEGRAHILRQLADAEGNGENGFFEMVLAKVNDAGLRQLIQKHKADELRHEQMFLDCANRLSAAAEPIPDSVKYVERVFDAVGFRDQPIESDEDIMNAYLLLQAVEERSVVQFALFERVFRELDVETAQVFVAIGKDEERHIKYCQAIARRYAPDAATHNKALARMRELEARAFAENGRANMDYTFSRGWFDGGPLTRWFFRTLSNLGATRLPLTPFAKETALELAPAVA
jgi:rubrerythrin